MKTKKLEAVYELEPIDTADGDELRFRLEIFSLSGRFQVVLRRWETLRVQPTFPQADGTPTLPFADHFILVEDESLDLSDIASDSVEGAVSSALARLDNALKLSS
jgi:hypothetical protein